MHLTPMWYLFDDDGRIILNSQEHLQKVKNIRRNPHASICIVEGTRYISITGSIKLIDEQASVRRDFERLVEHYIEDEATREQYTATFAE
ncbi:pyridoxamine 5'-phosphate oxidase-related FMN-binding protein [Ktedonobacter racemifer DSM 44963]|uniref:Pyridoxamine 5'-phosphate oxidase-related FMN-binding protein n=1 Tax=Ktedonobacter racemifer DSM 44963 TaxID=485913 RepID=D6U3D3_KTERA|nr:pyridoxamine 5'-phosphate oxidase-related FMN-binding protein [Ktedonobacter racemifer DSM 44963]